MTTKTSKTQIGVIGAGVIGLSTAISIQESLPDVDVTIIADKFLQETLSFGAGGLFRPEANIGVSLIQTRQWAKDSYDHFMDIALSSDADEAGMQLVSGFQINSFGKQYLNNNILSELIPQFRDMTEKEHQMFPSRFKYGVYWTTIITDPRYYLPWMTKRFIANGGTLEQRHINSLEEVTNKDIIVNCSGLNAKYLTNDWKLSPVRGQTIKVIAPWIKHFYYADDAYIIPGRDYVTLGGIKEYGDWNPNVTQLDRQSIWKRCLEIVPSLERAQIVFDWVGLRPQRQPVRIEKEIITSKDGKRVLVCHNYGHGGHGVTFSWGTAKHATKLVKELINNDFNNHDNLSNENIVIPSKL